MTYILGDRVPSFSLDIEFPLHSFWASCSHLFPGIELPVVFEFGHQVSFTFRASSSRHFGHRVPFLCIIFFQYIPGVSKLPQNWPISSPPGHRDPTYRCSKSPHELGLETGRFTEADYSCLRNAAPFFVFFPMNFASDGSPEINSQPFSLRICSLYWH